MQLQWQRSALHRSAYTKLALYVQIAGKFTPSGGQVTLECTLTETRPMRNREPLSPLPPGNSLLRRKTSQTGGGRKSVSLTGAGATGDARRSSNEAATGPLATTSAASAGRRRNSEHVANVWEASLEGPASPPCASHASPRPSRPDRRQSAVRSVEEVAGTIGDFIKSGLARITHQLTPGGGFARRLSTATTVGTRRTSGQRSDPLEEYLVFRIVDTGVGLSKEDLNRIFEPFGQGAEGKKSFHGGTGLGLVRRICHRPRLQSSLCLCAPSCDNSSCRRATT